MTPRNMFRQPAVALLALFCNPGVFAQEQRDHLQLSLLSEQSAIATGHTTILGLRFQLEPGWHIYWINSGDSGEPPRVKWNPSAGFTVGELQFPYPERLENPPLTDYGYKGDVLLMAPVSIPDAVRGPNAEFAAEVKWLVCREVCIPGKKDVRLSLPVVSKGDPPKSKDAGLFGNARRHLPMPLPKNWTASVRALPGHFLLSVVSGSSIVTAGFFPLEPQQIENSAQPELQPFARGVRLKLKKSEQLLKPIQNLKGVLVTDERAYLISAPVVNK